PDRVEAVEDATESGDVIGLIAEGKLGVAHLAVEEVAAMALVDEDAVVVVDPGACGVVVAKEAPGHALDGGDLEARGSFEVLLQLLDVEDLGEGEEALDP